MPASNRKVKIIQWLITLFLLGVLGLVVWFYISYGMKLAKESAVPEITTEIPVKTDNDPLSAEESRRMAILKKMAAESTSTISESERNSILQKMEAESQSSTSTVSEADRRKILQSLESSTAVDIKEEVINE